MYYDKYDVYVKAKSYEIQPENFFSIQSKQRAIFSDDHHIHKLIYQSGDWYCDCREFNRWYKANIPGYKYFCSHVIALRKYIQLNLISEQSKHNKKHKENHTSQKQILSMHLHQYSSMTLVNKR